MYIIAWIILIIVIILLALLAWAWLEKLYSSNDKNHLPEENVPTTLGDKISWPWIDDNDLGC